MCHNSNTFFWTRVEPFQELNGTSTTGFITLAFVGIIPILVGGNLGEIEVWEFATNFVNRSASVAYIVSKSLPALFSDKETWSRNFDPSLELGTTNGRFSVAEKCRKTGFARVTKDMQCCLAGTSKWRDNYQVESRKGSSTRRAVSQDLSKGLGLVYSLGSESRVVQRVFVCALSFWAEETIVAASLLRLGVVISFCVTDEVNLSSLIG